MCGICGIIGTENKVIIRSMCRTMAHRGPDDEGYYNDTNISLGHRRLKIIDLKTGHQPIHNEDESVWIIFNGEIYNYKELRKDLEEKGHVFYTNSDTETIVHCYEEYGENCVNFLNGMFAFALWDKKKKSLFLFRDRMGIKPLYYAIIDKNLVFASEIKAILKFPGFQRELNYNALNCFFTLGYIPSPLTMFKGIKKLPPGYLLLYQNSNLKLKEYYDLNFNIDCKIDKTKAAKQVKELLTNSIKYRMISDVPLGAFLSGGIDSGAIVGIMSKLSDNPVKTFSIGFEEQTFNELKYARIISDVFNTDHSEIYLEPKTTFKLFPKVIKYFDEPIMNESIIPNYMLCKHARKKVTVALTGIGSDEIFAGYYRYEANRFVNYYALFPDAIRKIFSTIIRKIPEPRSGTHWISRLKRFSDSSQQNLEDRFYSWRSNLDASDQANLFIKKNNINLNYPVNIFKRLSKKTNATNSLNKLLYFDIKTYLTYDLLELADKTSMANSFEVRVPFLDVNLVDFVSTLPPKCKLHYFNKKYILKKALSGVLPKEILYRKKQGFNVPYNLWFQLDLKSEFDGVFAKETFAKLNAFNKKCFEKIFNDHYTRKKDYAAFMQGLFSFLEWHKLYFLDNS